VSFQAYLRTIQAKTGQAPQDIAAAARGQGLSKPGEVVAWLKNEYGLGHGHAMAIVALTRRESQPSKSGADRIDAHFTGAKARWRPAFDRLVCEVTRLGPDVTVSPAASYLSLVKAGRKFAIVQVGGERLDIGLKLKGVAAGGRLEPAGAWNAMVTHRVRIASETDLDAEVLDWLEQAWAGARAR
jgi:hypothetical protein